VTSSLYSASALDWVNSALSHGGGPGQPSIAALSVEVFKGSGMAMLSQLARLHLTYEPEDAQAPPTLILKLASTYPPAAEFAAAQHYYEREVGFYRDLAPQGGLPAPVCYWCDFDAGSGRFGILLADLGHLACEDMLSGISKPRLDVAGAGLADMHARWWGSPSLEAYDWLPAGNWGPQHAMIEGYRQLWPVFWERFGPTLPEGSIRFGHSAADAMHQSLDELVRGPKTLAHRDFRLDNLFFGGTPERLVAVDWQMASRMVGTYDIACLLTQSTSVQLRQERQWEVLRAWHDRVRSKVATPYSYEDAVADYRRSALVGLLKPVLGGAYHEPGDARGDQLLAAVNERAFCAAVDLGLEALL
jgi:hypothetical protein